MDLDKEFVRSIIKDGEAAYKAAIDRGITAEHLFDEGKLAWEFVVNHRRQYGSLPSKELLISSLIDAKGDPIDLSAGLLDGSTVLIDKIVERRTLNLLIDANKTIAEKVARRNAPEAVEAFQEIYRKLQQERVTVSKIESLFSLGTEVLNHYELVKSGARGIPTPWPTMDSQTMGWWPEDLILIIGRLGLGKCVDKDTELVDPTTGVPHTIEEVVEGDQVVDTFTWSKERGIHAVPISAKIDTGTKECLRFTLRSGKSIVVTPEHPFLTVDGWRRADELAVGSSVATPASVPFPLQPVTMPGCEVDALALLLAEGSYTGNHTGFSTSDPEILRIAGDIAAQYRCSVVHRSDYDYDFVTTGVRNEINTLLRQHGIYDCLAKNKSIPEAVYRLSASQLSRFLSVFWMCDGYVDDSPGITLASRKMIYQIQHLLLRFGIVSYVNYKQATCDGKKFDAWRLSVLANSYARFHDCIKLWGAKAARLEALVRKDGNLNVGFPLVSDAFKRRISQIVEQIGTGRWGAGGLKRVGQQLGWKSKFGLRNLYGAGGTLLLERFQAFCDEFKCTSEFQWIWNSGIFWDEVTSIEGVGERKIYDLTVAQTSCFVANDIIVHNTWSLLLLTHAAWAPGKRVLICSTEMSRKALAQRFLCMHLRIPYGDYRKGRLGAFVEEKLSDGIASMLYDQGINVVGSDFDYSIDALEAAVEEDKPDMLVVDGAYLIKNSGKDRHERVSNTFDDFKRISKRQKIAVASSTQFNRQAKAGQEESLSADNIGITDVAGWNADAAFGLYQTQEMFEKKIMGWKPLKIREGRPESFQVQWDLDGMQFGEIIDPTKVQSPSVIQAVAPDDSNDDLPDIPF